MRLIDADALVKELSGKYIIVPADEAARGVADFMGIQIRQAINNAPTIEAVPLEDYRSMEQTVHKLTQAIAETEPRWIPCSERLPEDGKYVLAYSADDDFMIVEAKHKFEAFQITHWMPLPKPYKADEVKK